MKRNGLIVLLVAFAAGSVVAIVLGGCGQTGSHGSAQSGSSPACLPVTLDHSAKLAGLGVDVSPAPETDTANPHTQISFLGVPAAQIHEVSVVGERSGDHAGHLDGYSQGDGASFVPDSPFDAGERVTVHAVIGATSGATGGASGGGRPIAFQFRVDTPYPTASTPAFGNPQASPADYQSFYTMPGVQAPVLTVAVPDRDPAAGDILTTNGPGPGQYGPLIYTPQGKLVWFDKLPGGEAAEDLNEQTYEGRRALTWWKGKVLSLGFGQGEDIVMSSSYQTVARITGGNGLKADLHDFQIAPHDISYTTAYNPIRCDLSPVKGSSRRGDRRHGDSGDRYEDGPRTLGMAQPRPRRRGGVRSRSPDGLNALGLLPPQLDRPRARREHLHLGAQHLGWLSAGRRQRQGPLATRG